MRLTRDLTCSELTGDIIFWTEGNRPTQRALALSDAEVSDSLKACFLLSDTVVAAASYFFESSATRRVTRELEPLFATGKVLFFVDEALESFAEHGLRKIEKSPSTLAAYRSVDTVVRNARELTRFGFILRRPALSISDLLVERWVDDLLSTDRHSLGAAISRLDGSVVDRTALRMKLIEIAQRRTTDFVWEVVAPVFVDLPVPALFQRLVQQRLTSIYGDTTASILGATPDSSDVRDTVEVSSPLDVVLFHRVLASLGAAEAFHHLTGTDCLTVKKSAEWAFFSSFYAELLAEMRMLQINDLHVLPLLAKAEQVWRDSANRQRGLSRSEFIAAIDRLATPLTRKAGRFSKPADFLLAICESFSRAPISDFIQLIMEKSHHTVAITDRPKKAVGIITIKPVELRAVRELFKQRGRVEEKEGKQVNRRFFEGTLSGHRNCPLPAVCLRALTKGNPSVQSACNALLTEYDVHVLILLGVAGGISRKLKLCDVVVADAVFNYETRAITDQGTAFRLDPYRMSAPIAELYGRFEDEHGEEAEFPASTDSRAAHFSVYRAPIGSGEAVVKSKLAEVGAWLEMVNENVAAVETEAVGASYVEHELTLWKRSKPIGLLIVRGISDHADFKKKDRWQFPSSANACIVLDKVLRANAPLKDWANAR
jgi:nucleoside phosphorylase